MLDPVNGPGAGGMVKSAQDGGAQVVAYDRFIADADYYLSFDNETVGKFQAQALVDAMGDKGNIIVLNGDPKDPNAAQFKAGAHSVLDSSGLKILAEFDNPDWSAEEAQQFTNDQITKFGADKIEGVYAANDQQAGGAIAALTGARRFSRRTSPGHRAGRRGRSDAADPRRAAVHDDLQAVQDRGRGAAQLAVDLANEEEPADTTDFEGVASYIYDPIVVTKDNVDDTVIKDGLYTVDEICTAEYADACAAAGTAVMTSLTKAPVGESVLSLTGVAKRFGAVQALTDVHLDVGAGEVVALVGDNGAGKSTLVKIIAGVYQNDAGTISLSGQEVKVGGPSQAQALGIATVFQDLALCDNLDVVANLFLGQERTQGAVLDEVEMEKESWRLLRTLSAKIPSVRIPIASLSGGQRQTVAIARSLVGKPKVVMLDEPTAALGVAQTAEVLNLIERLRETGLGVILVSHNMADVQAVADRIVVLRLGRNAAEFRVEDVSTAELVAAITGASDNVVAERAAKNKDGSHG